MTTPIPTPRTDAEDHWRVDQSPDGTLYVDAVRADHASDLERENETLRAALKDCCERMERARDILSKEGNWGMLDTTTARKALEAK